MTKTELSHKKELAESAQNELQELLAKQTEQMLELKKLTEKLQVSYIASCLNENYKHEQL